ncbi:alpha/beta hydrolase [Nocardia sp. SYP-A9097]|uniref:alpha/beta hydrolase family protein n=1 Tax=Nocardia sp. SYP-A9097 TaxID=2663237 RepID=UPI00129AF30B|nr:alpha/beta hydrolase [Nocardia sp. SYP-A9097]MRH91683.1 alpha/beta hydrolase [Nocardia sp. SYP-A9097]
MNTLRRTLISLAACTATTEVVARHVGAGPLLPRVLVHRFSRLAAVPPAYFAAQLDGARSFSDQEWSEYWSRIAQRHLDTADGLLRELAATTGMMLADTGSPLLSDDRVAESAIRALLAPAAEFLTDRDPEFTAGATERFTRAHVNGASIDERLISAARAVDSIRKAIVYYLVAAWPYGSPARMHAYTQSQRLFRVLVAGLAPGLGISVEVTDIRVGSDVVRVWMAFPAGNRQCATLLATNGLDGTAQELFLPLLRYRRAGVGFAVMEMPGTYAYSEPMSAASERVYSAVIDQLVRHPRVAPDRLGMLGLSFGGYWAARMAAADSRVRCAVAGGPPTHRSLGPAGAVGVPAVLLRAMRDGTGARGLLAVGPRLRALSLRNLYGRITVPLLVVNGSHDAVTDVRDSAELAAAAAQGELRLYPGDDHCAAQHFPEWLGAAVEWAVAALAPHR